MCTTLAIDDDLLDKVRRLSGVRGTAALVREGLTWIIHEPSPWGE